MVSGTYGRRKGTTTLGDTVTVGGVGAQTVDKNTCFVWGVTCEESNHR